MSPGTITNSANATVITGASGFIGGALVHRLHGLGRPVSAISRRAGQWPAGVRRITVSGYEDAAALDEPCAGAGTVVHLAAVAHRGATAAEFGASVAAAEAVARAAARAHASRFVLVSSIGVNGNRTEGVPINEESPKRPEEAYAISKLQAEEAVTAALRGSRTDLVIVRPPLVYGPHAPGNFRRLVRLVCRGLPLPFASIHNARTFIGLSNLLDLLVLCVEHPAAAGELFVAGDAQDLSTPDLARRIGEGVGCPARLVPMPPGALTLGASVLGQRRLADSLCASLQVDTSKARRLLGWHPAVAAADGVRQAARSFVAS